jgi:hypothetical protein
MKKNYFLMALVAIMFAVTSAFFTSCDLNEPNDPLSASGKTAYGLKWDNIVKYVLQIYGPTVVEIESDHYSFYWSENRDTLYIEKPTNYTGDTTYIVIPVEVHDTTEVQVIVHDTIINEVVKTVYDTVYQIDTTVLYDTVYVTQDMKYIVNVVYGEENGYNVEKIGDTLVITITFVNVAEDYNLDIKPVYNGNLFESGDRTVYSSGGQNVLAGTNARSGIMSYDRENSSAARMPKARNAAGGRDTLWVASIDSYTTGTANRAYVSRKQSAGTRDNFQVAKDSCVYTFNNDGINYNMNIVAESLEGSYKGETKTMLAALPDGATYEIINNVDMTDEVIHEGKVCHKVHQVVRGTFTSRVLPERGMSRTHTDVVTLDNDVDVDMPVIYLVGEPVPDPSDTTETPDPTEPEGFIFPDGEYAIAAQISVVVDRSRGTLEEAILIHTAKSLYWVVSGTYVGSTPCTNHSLYNSLYMENGVWAPAYLVSQSKGVMWYSQKGGSQLKGMPKDEIDHMIQNGLAHITTNYTGSFVRDMVLRHVGKTTTFSVDGSGKFTASSSTVTH